MLKSIIKNHSPLFIRRWLSRTNLYTGFIPPVGKIKKGDFHRLKPFCSDFGYMRGKPIDRYYVENFLQKEDKYVKGRVLEIGDNEYTLQYGSNKITQSDILHIHPDNPKATFIGDISNAPHIPSNIFDCIILTQTLQLIWDFRGALNTCNRILKPEGTLLLTVPVITAIDQGEWKDTWYWSFTDKALQKLLTESFPSSSIDIEVFGNVNVATAFLYGMSLAETPQHILDYKDPQFQVTITAKVVKNS